MSATRRRPQMCAGLPPSIVSGGRPLRATRGTAVAAYAHTRVAARICDCKRHARSLDTRPRVADVSQRRSGRRCAAGRAAWRAPPCMRPGRDARWRRSCKRQCAPAQHVLWQPPGGCDCSPAVVRRMHRGVTAPRGGLPTSSASATAAPGHPSTASAGVDRVTAAPWRVQPLPGGWQAPPAHCATGPLRQRGDARTGGAGVPAPESAVPGL